MNTVTTQKITIPGCELTTVALSDIDAGERFRQDYGDLADLEYSIKMHGLINPITLTPDPTQPGRYRLVAGGRRLEALKHMGETQTIARIFPEPLDELGLRLLELAENLQRKDMTWSEQNALQREIHKLQQSIHGESSQGSSEGWTIQDTAKMLGVSDSQVAQSIRLADKFDKYSSVLGDPSKYRTENDAKKAVKVVEEALARAELMKRAKAREGSATMLQLMEQRYQLRDVFDGLATIPSESIDFVECDPPYGICLPEVKNQNECADYRELPAGEYIIFNATLLKEIYRILKPDTFCVLWFAIDPWLETLYKLCIEADFQLKRTPLVWIKPNGQSLAPSYNLASAYEAAFILKKGNPILAKPGRTNVFQYAPVPAQAKYHPTQKPLELYQDIYQTFSFENAQCVTPFAGSGASIIAAHLCGRQCLGFDLSEDFKKGYLQAVTENFLGAN